MGKHELGWGFGDWGMLWNPRVKMCSMYVGTQVEAREGSVGLLCHNLPLVLAVGSVGSVW